MSATRKLNPSARIAIMAVALGGLLYAGYQAYAGFTIDRATFPPVQADDISLVAIDSSRGYRVIVANQMAQLAEVGEGRERGESGDEESDASLENLKRLPIKELLEAHSGNTKALSVLITRTNDLDKEGELPTVQVTWSVAEIEKALAGDPALRSKLERNLNIRLDGTPLAGLSVNAIENGIVVPVQVPVKFTVGGQPRTMTAEVPQWFLPSFSQTVMNRYKDETDVTPERIVAYYQEEAGNLKDKQDIAKSLRSFVDPKGNSDWSRRTGNLLDSTNILMNSGMITGVRLDERTGDSGKKWLDIHLDVTDEGRRRLWQFSRNKKRFQLMLIVNGIAIAAPTVREELSASTVTISNVPDEEFIRDAVSTIQERVKK